MRPALMMRWALAASTALMLFACSATRSSTTGPAGPQDLAKYALAFEQQADRQVTHAWIPLKDFDLEKVQRTLSAAHSPRNIVCASSSGLNEYCDGRHDQCVNDCLKSSKPFAVGRHKYTDTKVQAWSIARGWWCPSNCLEASVKCKKGRGEWAAEFDSIEPAVDWIKRHRTELVVGTVVVIAGVAFAVVIVGTGGTALILVPALLMTESAPALSPERPLAEACG